MIRHMPLRYRWGAVPRGMQRDVPRRSRTHQAHASRAAVRWIATRRQHERDTGLHTSHNTHSRGPDPGTPPRRNEGPDGSRTPLTTETFPRVCPSDKPPPQGPEYYQHCEAKPDTLMRSRKRGLRGRADARGREATLRPQARTHLTNPVPDESTALVARLCPDHRQDRAVHCTAGRANPRDPTASPPPLLFQKKRDVESIGVTPGAPPTTHRQARRPPPVALRKATSGEHQQA